mmetsp:Transcript_98396/g.312169  ORF Transcript_98396/g.312169 Transcript_98396/m.312169 type:complete len:277 (-) Transcript_98396:94-924(-)
MPSPSAFAGAGPQPASPWSQRKKERQFPACCAVVAGTLPSGRHCNSWKSPTMRLWPAASSSFLLWRYCHQTEPPMASSVRPSSSPRQATRRLTAAEAMDWKTAFSPMRVTMAISLCADKAASCSLPSRRCFRASSSSAWLVEYLPNMALAMRSSWVSTARSHVTPHGASGSPATGPSANAESARDSMRASARSGGGRGRFILRMIRASASCTSGPGGTFHWKSSSQPRSSDSHAARSRGFLSSLQRTVMTSSAESSGLSTAAKPRSPRSCAFPSLP